MWMIRHEPFTGDGAILSDETVIFRLLQQWTFRICRAESVPVWTWWRHSGKFGLNSGQEREVIFRLV
jgi:hypothetical protein